VRKHLETGKQRKTRKGSKIKAFNFVSKNLTLSPSPFHVENPARGGAGLKILRASHKGLPTRSFGIVTFPKLFNTLARMITSSRSKRRFFNYSTISFPLSIPIPQVKVYSPGFSGVNSIGVVLKVGKGFLILKSPNTIVSEQSSVSSR